VLRGRKSGYAPVEMTILFEDRIPRFQEKHEVLAATKLSSRPERSVVERSAVFWVLTQTLKPDVFSIVNGPTKVVP
jgi:hypothetical protein